MSKRVVETTLYTLVGFLVWILISGILFGHWAFAFWAPIIGGIGYWNGWSR